MKYRLPNKDEWIIEIPLLTVFIQLLDNNNVYIDTPIRLVGKLQTSDDIHVEEGLNIVGI